MYVFKLIHVTLQGMKPSFWSKTANGNCVPGEIPRGWTQECADVKYEPSSYAKDINELNPNKSRSYMQLSFEFRFTHFNDEVYCAYTVPYTYTAM